MLIASALFFALAAVVGLTLALKYFKGDDMPLPLSFIHGALAVTGLVLLILGVTMSGIGGYAQTALYVFIVAALGGIFLFLKHLRGESRPKAVILIHAAAAITAFVLLVLGIF
jgi:FtsH-binding integral membrane protein